jgi:hypothetical protein
VNWRWLIPAAGAALFFTVAEGSTFLSVVLGVLTLVSVAYAMAGAEYARNDHFVHGHVEGELVPLDYRVVTAAREEPIEQPWEKPSRLSFSGMDEPERLTRHVSQRLALPAVLQHVGLVIYRATEPEARQTESELHRLLDPLFAEPIEVYVERWNGDLALWQPPDKAGGDKATLAALGWEARIRCADKSAARVIAARIRDDGEVMVGLSRRVVLVAFPDESGARAAVVRFPELAGAAVSVRRLTRLRRRLLLSRLYDRQSRMGGGWLQYDEPAAA